MVPTWKRRPFSLSACVMSLSASLTYMPLKSVTGSTYLPLQHIKHGKHAHAHKRGVQGARDVLVGDDAVVMAHAEIVLSVARGLVHDTGTAVLRDIRVAQDHECIGTRGKVREQRLVLLAEKLGSFEGLLEINMWEVGIRGLMCTLMTV